MAKGRKFVPPPDREGFWFPHLGSDNSDASTKRTELTSTGDMLSTPFKDTGRPRPPPRPYDSKAQTTYRATNPFSAHDQKNSLQDYGEHLGDGRVTRNLGRKLLAPLEETRHHYTDPDFLTHHCRNLVLYHFDTEFASNYTVKPLSTPRSRRLFPRQRQQAHVGPLRPLPTTTTDWDPNTPRSLGSIKASNRVLEMTQKPFLKPNSWKYSYHGLPKVYPIYDPLPNKRPAIDVPYSRHFVSSTQSE